jgi:hypothetical protein
MAITHRASESEQQHCLMDDEIVWFLSTTQIPSELLDDVSKFTIWQSLEAKV